jgi:hypothetical protein
MYIIKFKKSQMYMLLKWCSKIAIFRFGVGLETCANFKKVFYRRNIGLQISTTLITNYQMTCCVENILKEKNIKFLNDLENRLRPHAIYTMSRYVKVNITLNSNNILITFYFLFIFIEKMIVMRVCLQSC